MKTYPFNIDLKSDKGKTIGTIEMNEKGDCWIRLFSTDNKSSTRRKIGFGSAVDVAKSISDAYWITCKTCKKKLSIEKGEFHHGCLNCYLGD